jgi:hypothetical protein
MRCMFMLTVIPIQSLACFSCYTVWLVNKVYTVTHKVVLFAGNYVARFCNEPPVYV